MQFKKISIPAPWKINGNSEGVGGLESENFKSNVWGLTGILRWVGRFKLKNLWEGYGYFLEQYIKLLLGLHDSETLISKFNIQGLFI